MLSLHFKKIFAGLLIAVPFLCNAQQVKVLTNHIGYEDNGPKLAIIQADKAVAIKAFNLVDAKTDSVVLSGTPVYKGSVVSWKNRFFWTIDFSRFTADGNYRLKVMTSSAQASSYPFIIGKDLLEQNTLSNVVYYFKGQRSSGLFDKADHHLILAGKPGDTIDAHGGWYDATGDYGKHLSHLSFSNYFNPQQISFTAYSLFKTYALLSARPGTSFRQIDRRVLDEAMYGADYLVRMHPNEGSFYRSVSAPGPGKLPEDRVIQADEGSYRIKQNKDQSFSKTLSAKSWRSYQSSYRSGGGMAIAALAMAFAYPTSGDYPNAAYLKAAEEAFAFLEQDNALMDYDGKENILDDYCALSAATELYRVTQKEIYYAAATRRANALMARLSTWKNYNNYWRADDKDRPFFHPSDAGLPVVSLLYFYQVAAPEMKSRIKSAVKLAMGHELAITGEVNNPFGYSRQLVQDTLGNRKSSFFFPHGSDAAPWWQGENARLGSMAAAAKMAADIFTEDKIYHDQLESFALNQLNWILGLNPFDSDMLQGTGHNNPAYGFFGTFEYTNAPGGIVNGITSGLYDEDDINFNVPYSKTSKDSDWRWAEQWLPHTSWFLLAIATK